MALFAKKLAFGDQNGYILIMINDVSPFACTAAAYDQQYSPAGE